MLDLFISVNDKQPVGQRTFSEFHECQVRKVMRGAYFLSLRSLGGFPRENFRILVVHQCDFNALFGHLVLQSQGMMLITFHRLENLQITDTRI